MPFYARKSRLYCRVPPEDSPIGWVGGCAGAGALSVVGGVCAGVGTVGGASVIGDAGVGSEVGGGAEVPSVAGGGTAGVTGAGMLSVAGGTWGAMDERCWAPEEK
jgi:hypothetical protein